MTRTRSRESVLAVAGLESQHQLRHRIPALIQTTFTHPALVDRDPIDLLLSAALLQVCYRSPWWTRYYRCFITIKPFTLLIGKSIPKLLSPNGSRVHYSKPVSERWCSYMTLAMERSHVCFLTNEVHLVTAADSLRVHWSIRHQGFTSSLFKLKRFEEHCSYSDRCDIRKQACCLNVLLSQHVSFPTFQTHGQQHILITSSACINI